MDVFQTVVLTAETKTSDTTVALSATGQLPVTHYLCSGYIPQELVAQLQELPNADVTTEDPFVVMQRLGLQMLTEELNG